MEKSLLEQCGYRIALAVTMPEVFSRKVHLELELCDVVEKKKEHEKAIDHSAHIAQQIEQSIEASPVSHRLVRPLDCDHR